MNLSLCSKSYLRQQMSKAIEAKNQAYSDGNSDKVDQAKRWIDDLSREMNKRGM